MQYTIIYCISLVFKQLGGEFQKGLDMPRAYSEAVSWRTDNARAKWKAANTAQQTTDCVTWTSQANWRWN